MKKRLLSLLFMLALCLGLLPATALAATVENIIYLDENGTQQTAASATQVTNSDTQWTDGWYVAQSNITIDGTVTISGNVHLILEDGCNLTVNGGILLQSDGNMYIYAQSTEKERMGSLTATGTDAGFKEAGYDGTQTLTIAGGKISASGSDVGISAVNLTITDGYVSALGTDLYGDSIAVYNATISGGFVDLYGDFTGTLSTGIDGHAVISSTGEIKNIAADCKGFFLIQKTGKIYGDTFTLTQDLNIANSNIVVTVEEGQTLTLDDGVTLTIPVIATLTNNGTLNNNGTIINTGTLNNSGTLNNNGTLNNTNVLNNAGSIVNNGTLTGEVNGSGTVTPKITTDSPLPEGTVGKSYTATLEATGNNITWSSSGMPEWMTLGSTGVISGTPTTAGESRFTVTATNASGSDSKEFTITVNYQPTTITSQPTNQDVTEGQAATFTVIATGNNLTYQWQYSMDKGRNWMLIGGATSDNSYTTAATTVNVTGTQYRCVVKGADGREVTSDAATLTVNPVTVTGVTLDKTTLDLVAGNSATLKATVAPDNATNKTVTWASSNTAIATVDTTGKVTAVAPGTATITATAADGSGKTATCKVTVTAKTYSLSIDPGAIGFGTAAVGYTQPAVREVTVKNTGNQTLTLTHPTAVNFELGKLNQLTLAPGEKAVFTVRPKAGLSAGSYSETVVVKANSGTQVSVNLTFTVQNGTTATPVTESRTLHFNTMGGLPMDDVKFGLGAPVELWPYTPVRTGYLFQGWYADEALTQPVSTIVLVKDTTIYAKWAVDPAAQAASGSGSGSSGSGSGGSGSGSKATPTPSPSPTPEPTATPTPTPEPTATPEPTPEVTPAPEETDKGGFPILPVAAGVVVLAALAGGIVWFRRR